MPVAGPCPCLHSPATPHRQAPMLICLRAGLAACGGSGSPAAAPLPTPTPSGPPLISGFVASPNPVPANTAFTVFFVIRADRGSSRLTYNSTRGTSCGGGLAIGGPLTFGGIDGRVTCSAGEAEPVAFNLAATDSGLSSTATLAVTIQ